MSIFSEQRWYKYQYFVDLDLFFLQLWIHQLACVSLRSSPTPLPSTGLLPRVKSLVTVSVTRWSAEEGLRMRGCPPLEATTPWQDLLQTQTTWSTSMLWAGQKRVCHSVGPRRQVQNLILDYPPVTHHIIIIMLFIYWLITLSFFLSSLWCSHRPASAGIHPHQHHCPLGPPSRHCALLQDHSWRDRWASELFKIVIFWHFLLIWCHSGEH